MASFFQQPVNLYAFVGPFSRCALVVEMYFQFLIEDKSGMILVENIMDKLGVLINENFYTRI